MDLWPTLLDDLHALKPYLTRFPLEERPARAEHITAKAFASIFHLPLFTRETDDINLKYRVTWMGTNENLPIIAPPGPDIVVRAHDFDSLVEVTLSSGVRQWAREFAQSVRHLEDFMRANNLPREDIYCILVASEISGDTYASLRVKQIEGFNLTPVTFANLAEILETVFFIRWLRHIEIRRLFDDIAKGMKNIRNVDAYQKYLVSCIHEWKKEILGDESWIFLGLKAYRVFEKIGRKIMTASEMMIELQKDPMVKRYFNVIERSFDSEEVSRGLLSLGLAYRSGQIGRDIILTPVSLAEFESRVHKILDISREV